MPKSKRYATQAQRSTRLRKPSTAHFMLAPTVIIQTGCFCQKQNEGQLFPAPNKHSVVNALRLANLKIHGDAVAKHILEPSLSSDPNQRCNQPMSPTEEQTILLICRTTAFDCDLFLPPLNLTWLHSNMLKSYHHTPTFLNIWNIEDEWPTQIGFESCIHYKISEGRSKRQMESSKYQVLSLQCHNPKSGFHLVCHVTTGNLTQVAPQDWCRSPPLPSPSPSLHAMGPLLLQHFAVSDPPPPP